MGKLTSKYAFLALLLAIGLTWSALKALPDQNLHIKIYDVGQGDAILIISPSGKKVLIDGGPNQKVLEYLGRDLPFYDRRIDLVVLTHPHEDHLSGLLEVVKRYEVGQVWMEKVVHTSDIYLKWLNLLKEKGLKVAAPKVGDEIRFGDGLTLMVIWPPQEALKDIKDLNQTSIVVLLNNGHFSSLLTGDAGEEGQPYGLTQDDLLRRGEVEVLKVPHHGSKTAIRDDFLKKINPKTSIISVGANNKYDHPSPTLIQKLESVGSRVYRTDKNGTIEVVSTPKGWYTKTER